VNIASTAGVRPRRPDLVQRLQGRGDRHLALDGRRARADGIRVNVINPVIGETGCWRRSWDARHTRNRAKFIANDSHGRMSKPLDIANAALFLASDEASFVSGACLEVDGARCV